MQGEERGVLVAEACEREIAAQGADLLGGEGDVAAAGGPEAVVGRVAGELDAQAGEGVLVLDGEDVDRAVGLDIGKVDGLEARVEVAGPDRAESPAQAQAQAVAARIGIDGSILFLIL